MHLKKNLCLCSVILIDIDPTNPYHLIFLFMLELLDINTGTRWNHSHQLLCIVCSGNSSFMTELIASTDSFTYQRL